MTEGWRDWNHLLHPCLGIQQGLGWGTHQRTEVHDQQIGRDLCALGQTLEQRRVLQGAGGNRRMVSSWEEGSFKFKPLY